MRLVIPCSLVAKNNQNEEVEILSDQHTVILEARVFNGTYVPVNNVSFYCRQRSAELLSDANAVMFTSHKGEHLVKSIFGFAVSNAIQTLIKRANVPAGKESTWSVPLKASQIPSFTLAEVAEFTPSLLLEICTRELAERLPLSRSFF